MDLIREMIAALADFFLQYGVWGLIIVSFIESSFFPVIPDVLLIPLALANRELALWYGVLTTASSVLGAVFGWWIGKRAGRPLMNKFFSADKIEKVEQYFQKYGGAALAIAGFTPIPYKVFTIASGMSKVKLNDLIWWSLLGRGARFMLEAVAILAFGQYAVKLIDEYLGVVSIALVVAIILAYVGYRVYKARSLSRTK
ncbi:YqaA family protein [Numidum massiliense]|uniref:YqaA family protein n=1 Tax=Numidum massiliense TaxID=1522315 RepID=UPI000A952313|nr:YqaA family protein [Numidum massiliense]